MDDSGAILREALGWVRSGRRAALATVVATWGSSPRPVGSRLAVDELGHFIGSVSGGCIEGEVLANAEEAIATGKPGLLEFGVSDGKAWAQGLACGGKVRVFVEPLVETATLELIAAGLERGEEQAALVDLQTGARRMIEPGDVPANRCADAMLEISGREFFLEFWRPPLRLIVIGAVHIAQALAPIATVAGYRVALVDPRTAFATSERFAGTEMHAQWPEDFFAGAPLDARCAVVALTHEPRIDDPALIAALRSPAFYIGALGSRASAEKRRARLRANGFSEDALARIHGPVGLAIGAMSSAEIAIAIVAEMTAVLRQSAAQTLRSAAE